MTKNMITGSKGGSKKQHTPKEMEDNLISINKIKILLAVSDGECDPDFSLRDLYLDDVPVIAADGAVNYEGVKAEFRPGTQTQDYIQGFTDTSSEVTLARDITTSTPYVISVTNKTLSAIRIKMLMPTGMKQEDNGDIVGVSVNYAVDMAIDGDSYKEVLNDTIDGKTRTGYDRSRRIDLPQFNERVLLRVRRVTPDSTSAKVTDLIKLQSYAEVVDAKFRYPLTGLVYVEFDSELFPNQIPNISIKKKWKIVNVPSNYDPVLREYHGTWDGTFKKAWSNNPAWVLYDLVTNQRYGLDQRELGIQIDKWSLYEAGVYCDQKVPDGKGGTEPRYLCDVVIQSQIEAYQLIRDICSIFRGMTFWNGESLSIVVDKPRDPSYIFTNDNVIGGDFQYTTASEKSMYTQCNVTFDDEQNMYQQDVEGVFDTEAALRFGYNPTSITAIGCTRRSEANRRGRWILKTNLRSTTVNFATGLEGMIPSIGDVIAVADNFHSSNLTLNLSGRVMEVSGLQVFVPFKVDARAGDFIIINKPDGKPVKRTISKVSADGKTIELNVGFGFDVKPDTVFAIDRTDIALQQYVVTGISKGDDDEEFTYSITAVEYDPNKYDEIDYGVNIDDRPTSIVNPDSMKAPENVNISSYSRIVQGVSVETMVVSWDKVPYASLYEMQWRKGDGNWLNTPQTANKEIEVEGIYSGNYQVRVRSVSAMGSASGWSKIATASLTGKVGDPLAPVNLTASDNEVFGIRVKWGMPEGSGDTAYIELHQSPDGTAENSSLLTLIPYPQYEYWHSTLPAGQVVWYRIRSVDRIGNVSGWTEFVRGMASDDVESVLGDILDKIFDTEAGQDLKENAIDSANKIKDQAQSIIQNALANDADVKWTRVQNGKRKAEYGHAIELIANETEARVTQIEELRASVGEEISSSIKTVQEAIATESETRATQVQQLDSKFTTEIDGVKRDTAASIGEVRQTITNESEARAQAVQQLDAKFTKELGDLNGAIKTEISANISEVKEAIANEEQARVSADQALTAKFGDVESALAEKLDSWADVNSVGAKYSMKLGLNYKGQQYSAGMIMQLSQSSQGLISQILFDANRFAIMTSSTGGTFTLPFVVENNQVFINSLLVKNGSINNAMIGNFIQSNNYIAGQQGWHVNKAGNAEFNQVVVRGDVYANNGHFRGSIDATDGTFRGTVEADRFIGDIVAIRTFGDLSSDMGQTVTRTYTFTDSGTKEYDKSVTFDFMVQHRSLAERVNTRFSATISINGNSRRIELIQGSQGGTISPVFIRHSANNVRSRVVTVTITIDGGSPSMPWNLFAPTIMIGRNSGSFSG